MGKRKPFKVESVTVSDFSDKKKHYDGEPRNCTRCNMPSKDFTRRLYGTINEYFCRGCGNYFSCS